MKKMLLAFSLLTTLNASYALESGGPLSDNVLDRKDFASAFLGSWTSGVSGAGQPIIGTMYGLFTLGVLDVRIDLNTLLAGVDDAVAYQASEGEIYGPNLATIVDIVKEQHPDANISVLEIAQGVTSL